MNKIPHVLAVLALAIPAAPTFAEDKVISYSDLNLESPEGQRVLERRITNAIEEVCQKNRIRTGTRVRSSEVNRCLSEARANAKKQVAAILEKNALGG